jgi:hypothetical protein
VGETMRRVMPVILAAAAFLVALDIVGAVTGKPLGFPYSRLGVVSLLVYVVIGTAGAWRVSFGVGVGAAAVVGFLDGTLGPLLAWLIGSGPVGQSITEPGVFAYGIAFVTATATGAGMLGAAAGVLLARHTARTSLKRS